MPAIDCASLRILVVDDNEDCADTIACLLRFFGHETWTEYDGRRAVEAAGTVRPDLILMDIGLPFLNGFEAARMIRRTLGQAVTLVAVTAYSSDADRSAGREAGFDYYLVKPVRFGDVEQIISDVAGRTPQTMRSPGIGR